MHNYILFALLLIGTLVSGQDYILEAENGIFTGSNSILTNTSSYSGTGAIGDFTTDFDTLHVFL